MKENLILIAKGFLMGIAKIIPGVSGAMMAIILNVYDKGLEAISHFFKKPFQYAKFLGTIAIGLVLAVVLFSRIIAFFLTNYYVLTMLLFIGFILGVMPRLFRSFRLSMLKRSDLTLIGITIVFILLGWRFSHLIFIFLDNMTSDNYFYWIFVGCLEAISAVVPGISGSALMMLMGCYEALVGAYANPLSNLSILLPFFIGFGGLTLLLARFMTYLFKRVEGFMKLLVICLMVFSLFTLLRSILIIILPLQTILLGIAFTILGFLTIYFLDQKWQS